MAGAGDRGVYDFNRLHDVKTRVQGRLRTIPGVYAVGVGPKISAGKHTGEPAIVVFVEKKKPLSELSPDEVIPAEIEGFKTDVHEAPRPHLISDTSTKRPVDGGIQIQEGGPLSGTGTLGCIARIDDPEQPIVALTREHVVGMPSGAPVDLVSSNIPSGFAFSGANTQGAIVVVNLNLTPDGGTKQDLDVIHRASAGTTPAQVAQGLSDKTNALSNPNISATFSGASVTFNPATDVAMSYDCTIYGLHFLDTSTDVRAKMNNNVITVSGSAKTDGGAYVALNRGGADPSYGVFAPFGRGYDFLLIAQAIAHAINVRSLPGITATVSNGDVTVTGVEELECDIWSDTRVGQPSNSFGSSCCHCCNKRIGRVIDAHLDLDVALIQLDAGITYKAEIEDFGVVSGSHAVTTAEVTPGPYNVHKRGCTTLLRHGIITALDVDNDIGDTAHKIFHRRYTGAIAIQANPTTVTFAEPGDSGSALLNDAHEVLGLVFAAGGNVAWAQPIQPMLDAFNLIIEVADTANVEKTVPQMVTHYSALGPEDIAGGNRPREPGLAAAIARKLELVEAEIESTSEGKHLAEVVRRHAEEAIRLANTNRRVATVWRRNRGPQIVQTAMKLAGSPEGKLPEEVEGKPVRECLRNIYRVFMRYGTSAFTADLSRVGPRLIELVTLRYSDLLAALEGTQA